MGHTDSARADIAGLREAARRYDVAAEMVEGTRHLAGTVFSAATAGRDYADRGDAIRRATEQVGEQLRVWSRSAREIAVSLRLSADVYAEADAVAARRIG